MIGRGKKKEGKERKEKIGIWSDRSKLSDSLLISNPTINRFFFKLVKVKGVVAMDTEIPFSPRYIFPPINSASHRNFPTMKITTFSEVSRMEIANITSNFPLLAPDPFTRGKVCTFLFLPLSSINSVFL